MQKKTTAEIEVLRQGGRLLAQILNQIIKMVKPGITTQELEEYACKKIIEVGGRPAFKGYGLGSEPGFPTALCTSINQEIVHAPALPSRELKNGDIIGIDVGMEWPYQNSGELNGKTIPVNTYSEGGGYYTDMARTVAVGKISVEAKKLMRVTRQCLEAAIKQAQPGNTINDIGSIVEEIAEKEGYGVVKELVGHGVGYKVHEKPDVFNYSIRPDDPKNLVLEPGMVIAIEPMINLGDWKIKTGDDGISVETADDSLSAHYENTIAITEKGPLIITEV